MNKKILLIFPVNIFIVMESIPGYATIKTSRRLQPANSIASQFTALNRSKYHDETQKMFLQYAYVRLVLL